MGIGDVNKEELKNKHSSIGSSGSDGSDFDSKQEEYCHMLDTFESTHGSTMTTCPSCGGDVSRVARVNESIKSEQVVIRYDKLDDFDPDAEEVTVDITTIKNRRINGDGCIILLFECMNSDCGKGYEVEFEATERRVVDSEESPYLSE